MVTDDEREAMEALIDAIEFASSEKHRDHSVHREYTKTGEQIVVNMSGGFDGGTPCELSAYDHLSLASYFDSIVEIAQKFAVQDYSDIAQGLCA